MFKAYPGNPVGLNEMSVSVFIERIELADRYIEPLKGREDYQIWRTRFHNLFAGLSPHVLEGIMAKPLPESMEIISFMLKLPGGEGLEKKNPILALY